MSKFGRRRRQRLKLQKEQRELTVLLSKHITQCPKPDPRYDIYGRPTHIDWKTGYTHWRARKCETCGLSYKDGGENIRVKFLGILPAEMDVITLLGLLTETACSG